MDALRPCPAAAVACAFVSTSGTSRSPRGFLPMGPRRSTALPKTQSGSGSSSMASRRKHGHAIAARKSRHFDFELDPNDDHETKVAKARRYLSGLIFPPDEPFHKERLKIDGSWCKISENFPRSILYLGGRTVALVLFLVAADAVKLASDVMDCASLRRGSEDEISLYTIKQKLGTHVSVIVSIVDDLSNSTNKVDRKTFLSLLGSLGGLAAVSHTLLQDALGGQDDTEDGSLNYNPDCNIERAQLEYVHKMNSFIDKFRTVSLDDAYEIVRPTLENAMRQTTSFVMLMIVNRKKALDQVTGRSRALDDADDGQPGGSATATDSS